MRRADLVVGGAYAIQQGVRWTLGSGQLRRCVVLSTEVGWYNRRDYLEWRLEENVVRYSGRGRGDRFPVAVERVETAASATNPETGEPWTAEDLLLTPSDLRSRLAYERGPGGLTAPVVTARRWYPYAARAAQIKVPWAEQVAAVEEERARRRAMYPARVKSERLQEEQDERRRAQIAAADARRRAEEASCREFYDTRLEPALVELGIAHKLTPGYRAVEFELGELYRLLYRVREEP